AQVHSQCKQSPRPLELWCYHILDRFSRFHLPFLLVILLSLLLIFFHMSPAFAVPKSIAVAYLVPYLIEDCPPNKLGKEPPEYHSEYYVYREREDRNETNHHGYYSEG